MFTTTLRRSSKVVKIRWLVFSSFTGEQLLFTCPRANELLPSESDIIINDMKYSIR